MPACRSCGTRSLVPVLDLGTMPLANALLASPPPAGGEPRYPLELVFCPSCALVQITETVQPQTLFGHYPYFSSVSDSFLEHARRLSERLRHDRGLTASSLVVEVASNDGYLLQYYRQQGVPVLGIEPARNVADAARERGIPTIVAFFGHALARELRRKGMQADVLHAHNVLAHVADLNGFVAGIAEVLRDEGLAVIEVPYVKDLIDHCEFDTIYHEHLCYFADRCGSSARASRCGRAVAVHGVASPVRRPARRHRPSVGAARGGARLGVAERRSTAACTGSGRHRWLRDCSSSSAGGRRLAGYGPPPKRRLSQLARLPGNDRLRRDKSPHKQGRFPPGVHIPIRPPEVLLAERPDTSCPRLEPGRRDPRQQAEYRAAAGAFILPLPDPRDRVAP
jgi:SAM-dependent methyltransferase